MRIPSLKLSLHATGQYAKQIGGKMYYFGTCEVEALRRLAALVEVMQADTGVDPATFLRQSPLPNKSAFSSLISNAVWIPPPKCSECNESFGSITYACPQAITTNLRPSG